jgi:hypothetical protein
MNLKLPLASRLPCLLIIQTFFVIVGNRYRTKEILTVRTQPASGSRAKKKFDLRAHASIYEEVVGAARMLKMPLVNIHQPCDEYMRTAILSKLNSGRTRYISDMIRSVEEIPEFRNASTRIKPVHGSVRNETGRWILVLAAWTNGGYPIAKLYYEYGIFTVIYLHLDHNDAKKIHDDKLKGNLVVLGHLACDSKGLNALADRLEGLAPRFL